MPPRLLPAAAVREALGGVSSMTLWRWSRRKELNFPPAIVIGRRRYWRADELAAWIESR